MNTERSKAYWNNIYGSSDHPIPSPSQTAEEGGPWKNFGTSSMNAISFGFVATAILISMFLIMAIFEHLFKPTQSFSSPQSQSQSHHGTDSSRSRSSESQQMQKRQDPQTANLTTSYSSDFSVLMPGQQFPTFIAQPAPLIPCQREGVCWPPHQPT